MLFSASHVFNTDVNTFWTKVFFDPDYGRNLYLNALGFVNYETLEITGEPGGIRTRKTRMEPKNEAPAFLTKLIGGTLVYTEEGTFDPQSGVWSFRMSTNRLSDKVHISGKYYCKDKGPKQLERILETDLRVSVFGVGGTIEKFIEGETRKSYELTTAFTNRWIAERNL